MRQRTKTPRATAIVLLSALAVAVVSITARAAVALIWPDIPTFKEPPPALPAVVSPEVRPDRTVTFRLFAPRAGEVLLVDETKDLQVPLTPDEQGVWSVTVGPLEPQVYRYVFHVDGVPTLDPNNGRVKPGRGAVQNLVEVPGDRRYDLRPVPHGTLHVLRYESKSLGGKSRGLVVYTPPGYGRSFRQRYPVLYLLHGTGDDEHCWTRVGLADRILDNLIADGQAAPMVVVMPDGHAAERQPGDAPIVNTKAFEADLLGDVIPLVERSYRVRTGPEARALAGFSMGGGHTFAIAMAHLDKFAYVCTFSMGRGNPTEIADGLDPAEVNCRLKLLWVGCGRDDFLYDGSELLCASLRDKGIRHVWRPSEGGHTWAVWRKYLAEVLPLLFR
jgi:enterochelin esterase family protein